MPRRILATPLTTDKIWPQDRFLLNMNDRPLDAFSLCLFQTPEFQTWGLIYFALVLPKTIQLIQVSW